MAKPGDQMAGGTVGRGRLLASHADREQEIDTLKAAFVQGLLAKDEFDLRVGQTLQSRTYAELAAVTADIRGRRIGAQMPPPGAQAQAAGNTAVKSGVCTLTAVILAASTSVAAFSGPGAALIMALFLMGIGVIIAVIVALLVAGIRLLESPHQKRSSGQLPSRSSPGTGGQASRRPASGAAAGQFQQLFQPLPAAGPLVDQPDPGPSVIAPAAARAVGASWHPPLTDSRPRAGRPAPLSNP